MSAKAEKADKPAVKKPEAKEPEAKEPEAKEPEAKAPEAKAPEAKAPKADKPAPPELTPEQRAARRKEREDHALGLGLGGVYVGWLIATARTLGFCRDEGFYFAAASDYYRWFELLFSAPSRAMERAAIDPIWATNHEHPALMKSLFALSYMFLGAKSKIFDDPSTAYRFPSMVMMGVAIYVTYLFGARTYSRRAGVGAAIALGLMPRIFYHAHLACFDVPIMAMWIACIYVYWRAEAKGGIGAAVFAGVMYGLTLETKHNAWMLPAVFIPHALLVHGRAMSRSATRTGRIPIPASLVMMVAIGPAVFVALWPWLWNDTLPRVQEYVNFHVNHEYYNIEFLGHTYFKAPSPRAYMPVMIAATVPTVTLALFAVGFLGRLVALAKRAISAVMTFVERAVPRWALPSPGAPRDRLHTDALFMLGMLVPLSVFLLPRTPVFGGTKHWIPAYPFLALFAGRGIDVVITAAERALSGRLAEAKRPLIAIAIFAACFLAPLDVTSHSHPFGLSAYVPVVGGTAGGADLGLNRQFWGFTTQSLASYFQEEAPPGARIYIMDTSWPAWNRMIEESRLRPDLRGVASPSDADYSMVHHEQHMNEVDYNIWVELGRTAPHHVLTHDGVPIISVYKRAP